MNRITLSDGKIVDIERISLVEPDARDWCKVTMECGTQFECQDFYKIKKALDKSNNNT